MTIFRRVVGLGRLGEMLTAAGLVFTVLGVAMAVATSRGIVSNETHGWMTFLLALSGLGWPLLQAGVLLLSATLIADRIGPAREP